MRITDLSDAVSGFTTSWKIWEKRRSPKLIAYNFITCSATATKLCTQSSLGTSISSTKFVTLSIMYTADLIALIERHGFFCQHLYADDTQIYGSCQPQAIRDLQLRLSACI